MSIVVNDFHKSYDKTIAVQGVTFRVEPGEIMGLVGPNGAGKTTILRALAGILRPTRGSLAIAGHDLATDPVAAKTAVAYVADDPHFFDQLTVWEHLRFIAAAYRVTDWRDRARDLLTQFDLTEKRDTLSSELSRGMRQKLAICCGYLHQPSAILLDEPLTGLDPQGIRSMKKSVADHAARGTAVIISSHLLSVIEDLCTSVLVLHRGQQLLHGKLADLRQEAAAAGRNETLEDLFFRLTADEVKPVMVEAVDSTGT
jgi:ABC-2 type transport system ATP-binding protein